MEIKSSLLKRKMINRSAIILLITSVAFAFTQIHHTSGSINVGEGDSTPNVSHIEVTYDDVGNEVSRITKWTGPVGAWSEANAGTDGERKCGCDSCSHKWTVKYGEGND